MQSIELGKHKNRGVVFDTCHSVNNHILLLGKSGSGKSVQAQKIILELSRQKKTVVIFDLNSVIATEHIFPIYRTEFIDNIHEIDAYDSGIHCELFQPVTFSDGTKEKLVDTVGALVDVLSCAGKLGIRQRAVLRMAIAAVLEEGKYETDGFQSVDEALAEIDTSYAEAVREKLYQLTAHNVFRSGKFFIENGKINVVRLSKFDMDTQKFIAEVLLSYMWRMATVSSFRQDGLFVFLDECHNFMTGEKCTVNKILSEGRKFSLNLILATQGLWYKAQSVTQQKLMQCGLVLFFRPDMSQLYAQAKLISAEDVKDWVMVLQKLSIGEFVALGSLTLDGIPVEKPLKVSSRM